MLLFGRPSRIFTYIFKRCLLLFLSLTGGILVLIWLAESIYAIELMGGGQLSGLWSVLSLMTLNLPIQVAVISPITLALAGGWTLYTFLGDNELVAFYALGLSRAVLIRPFLIISCGIAILIYGINFYLTPICARMISVQLQQTGLTSFLRNIGAGLEGTFLHPKDGTTLYIRKISGDTLQGIFLYEKKKDGESYVYTAQEGAVHLNADGKLSLSLLNGTLQTRRSNDQAPSILSFQTFQYDLSSHESGYIRRLKLDERFFSDLYAPKDDYGKTIAPLLRVELNDRLSLPMWAPALTIMVLVALFALPLGRNRSSDKWLFGAMLGIVVIRVASITFYPLGIHMPSLLIFMFALPLGFIVVGLSLLLRDQ